MTQCRWLHRWGKWGLVTVLVHGYRGGYPANWHEDRQARTCERCGLTQMKDY